MSAQRPVQQIKEKDAQEWTTTAQKAYLLARQVDYCVARDTKSLGKWFCIELQKYFHLFPTEAITVEESLGHPEWSLEDKRLFEEKVSGSRLNGNYEHLPSAC